MKSYGLIKPKNSLRLQNKITLEIKHLYNPQLRIPKLNHPSPEKLMKHIIDRNHKQNHQSHLIQSKQTSLEQVQQSQYSLSYQKNPQKKQQQMKINLSEQAQQLNQSNINHLKLSSPFNDYKSSHIVIIDNQQQQNQNNQRNFNQFNNSQTRITSRSRNKIFGSKPQNNLMNSSLNKSLSKSPRKKIFDNIIKKQNQQIIISHESQQLLKQKQQAKFSKVNCRVMKPQSRQKQQSIFYHQNNFISESTLMKSRNRSTSSKRGYRIFPNLNKNQFKSDGDISIISHSSAESYARSCSKSGKRKKIFEKRQSNWKKKYQTIQINPIPEQTITPRNINFKYETQSQNLKPKNENTQPKNIINQISNIKTNKKEQQLFSKGVSNNSQQYLKINLINKNSKLKLQQSQNDLSSSRKIIKLGNFLTKNKQKTHRKSLIQVDNRPKACTFRQNKQGFNNNSFKIKKNEKDTDFNINNQNNSFTIYKQFYAKPFAI